MSHEHILEPPVRYWACPSCDTVDRTQKPEAHLQFHACPGFSGANLPLVEVRHPDDKPDAKHFVSERQDFIGDETYTPRIASIRTVHADGTEDLTVFAPTATIKAE